MPGILLLDARGYSDDAMKDAGSSIDGTMPMPRDIAPGDEPPLPDEL